MRRALRALALIIMNSWMARFCRDKVFVAVEAEEIGSGRFEGFVLIAQARLDLSSP
jgi:hypothetical protein